MIELQLASAAQLRAAAAAVRQFIGNAATVAPSETERIVRFRTNRTEDELAGLLSQLTGSGIRVAQFREVPTDLEDAFLSVAGSAGADTGRAEPSPRGGPTPHSGNSASRGVTP
jgi:ABC-2 type transport system ATP-binding protein